MRDVGRLADDLRTIATQAAALAEQIAARDPGHKLAIDVICELVPPGARLYASRAHDGTWWWYLTMPREWQPREDVQSRSWIHNEASGYFWDTGVAQPHGTDGPNTEDAALRVGMKRLLDATVR